MTGAKSANSDDAIMKITSRFWVWSLVILLLAFLIVPTVLDSWSYSQHHKRINLEKQKIAELVQAGDRGYDELVRLVPSLWFGNVSLALEGILLQTNRDRVADLCAIYTTCGPKRNHKEALARALGQLGDSRAAAVLIKDLESVGRSLELIMCDAEIESLGLLKAKEAGEILCNIVEKGAPWSIKEKAFVALGRIGDDRALPDAAKYIRGGDAFYQDWEIEQGAMNYLTRIGNSEAKSILTQKYKTDHRPELALCLVQLGDRSVLPDVRIQLKNWLADFAVHGWGGNWDFFYCVRALLVANDTESMPDLKQALLILTNGDKETQHYVDNDAHGYSGKLLLDEQKTESLVSDLKAFLKVPSFAAP